ncbi:hypothetical protein KEM55_004693 [Ascosphaera atra]|nr:hypothetical protein KEM55_004693 [Ascosphaera atra]
MALIKLHEQDFTTRPYPLPRPAHIQAAAILHHMLLQSPHNYEALLLLTRIYMLLGTGSLALQTFAKLNVKQMQYDSVAHNIFSRLSTIHPQPAPRDEGFETKDTDPQWAYRVALDFYRRSGRATTIAKVKGLETGAYVNIQGSINLQDQLDRSICQRMYALEERRVERLLGGAPNGRYDHIVFDKSPVVDRRNFEGFMNLEAPHLPTFEEHVRAGPLIGEHGLRAMTLTDTLFYLLRNPKPTPGKTSQPDVFQFAGFEKEIREEELTYAELDNVKIQLGLLKGVQGLASGQSGAADVQAAVDQVTGWVAGKAQQLSDETYLDTKSIGMSDSLLLPCWTYLHSNICRLETLNATTLFIQGVAKSKAAKVPKDALDALRSKVSQLLEIIRTNTKTLKRHLTSSGVLGAITAACVNGDDGLRGELEQHLDEASLELFAGSLMESWEEALDGVATCGMF